MSFGAFQSVRDARFSRNVCQAALALIFLAASGGSVLADPAETGAGASGKGGFFGCSFATGGKAFSCTSGEVYEQFYSTFTGLENTTGTPPASAPIAENLRLVENLYQNPNFGEVTVSNDAAYHRELAAINSQLRNGPALSTADIQWTSSTESTPNYESYPLISVYNIWNLADPVRDPNDARV